MKPFLVRTELTCGCDKVWVLRGHGTVGTLVKCPYHHRGAWISKVFNQKRRVAL